MAEACPALFSQDFALGLGRSVVTCAAAAPVSRPERRRFFSPHHQDLHHNLRPLLHLTLPLSERLASILPRFRDASLSLRLHRRPHSCRNPLIRFGLLGRRRTNRCYPRTETRRYARLVLRPLRRLVFIGRQHVLGQNHSHPRTMQIWLPFAPRAAGEGGRCSPAKYRRAAPVPAWHTAPQPIVPASSKRCNVRRLGGAVSRAGLPAASDATGHLVLSVPQDNTF